MLTISSDIPTEFGALVDLSGDVGGELIVFRPDDTISYVSPPVQRRYAFCSFDDDISFSDLYWGVLTHGFVDASTLPMPAEAYLRLALDVRRANETLDFQKVYGETRLLCHHRRLPNGWSAQVRIDLSVTQYTGSAPLSVFDAVERHREVTRLTAALDRLPVGILFIGASGRIRWKNASASLLLGADESVAERDNRLVFHDPAFQATFSRAIAFVLQSGATAYVTLPLSDQHRLLSISAAPFPDEAMVFFAPDDPKGALVEEALATLGLSPAERRIAMAIGCGESPNDISKATGRAYATIRRHLVDTYRKLGEFGLNMGVTSQRDLARLVGQVASIAGISRKLPH